MNSRLCSITTSVLPSADQPVEHSEQALDVGGAEPGGRLVEDEHPRQMPAVFAGRRGFEIGQQKSRELEPLRLAARQRRGGLPDPEVAEADRTQRVEPLDDGGMIGRKTRAPRRP